jgi:hypothetical protein
MFTILEIAIHKSFPSHTNKVWCASFTPAEIIALYKNGARECHDPKYSDIPYITGKLKKGEGGTHWWYFIPTGKVKEMLGKKYPKHSDFI